MNERYQNNGEKPVGKTRKSAASAKPVTKAASSVRVVDSSSKKSQGGRGLFGGNKNKSSKNQPISDRNRTPNLSPEEMDEYRKWNVVRNTLFAVAIAFTMLGPILYAHEGTFKNYYVLLVIGYAAIIFAIGVDIKKVQPLRRKNRPGTKITDRSKDATRRRKEEKALDKQLREQEAAEAEAKAAAKAEKKGRGLFGKK